MSEPSTTDQRSSYSVFNWRKRVIFPAVRILINLVFFAIFIKEASIVRGDGPVGFGELALKGLAILITIPILLISIACSFFTSSNMKRRFILIIVYAITTIWLIFLAAIAVIDACSDKKGHCRDWSLFAAHGPAVGQLAGSRLTPGFAAVSAGAAASAHAKATLDLTRCSSRPAFGSQLSFFVRKFHE